MLNGRGLTVAIVVEKRVATVREQRFEARDAAVAKPRFLWKSLSRGAIAGREVHPEGCAAEAHRPGSRLSNSRCQAKFLHGVWLTLTMFAMVVPLLS